MCGRCACTRDKDSIQRACCFKQKGGSVTVKPTWVAPNDQTYYPSYNISPQANTPVLISGNHEHIQHYFSNGNSSADGFSNERVIQVMKWGLIPSWHKGEDVRSFPTLLNNCRFDGMFDKPSFRNAIHKRQRCVVLADGFYEWQRDKPKDKKPFYIYPRNEITEDSKENVILLQDECGAVAAQSQDGTSDNTPLLSMAGYFDIWKSNSEVLYSYTIITVDASKQFSSIHHRMPAILESEEAIDSWINPHIPTQVAVRFIDSIGREDSSLSWHPVSSHVNYARNKSAECIKKVDHSAVMPPKGTQSLLKWFKKSSEKASSSTKEDITDLPLPKKAKMEK